MTDIYLFDSKGYEKSMAFDHSLIEKVKINKPLMIAGNIQVNDNLDNYKASNFYIFDLPISFSMLVKVLLSDNVKAKRTCLGNLNEF